MARCDCEIVDGVLVRRADDCRREHFASAPPEAQPRFGAPKKKPGKKSHLEERMAIFIRAERLPRPVRQLRFAKAALKRNWLFDFAWPELGIALEIDGGTFMAKGGHNTGMGIMNNAEKANAATLLGWRVFRVTDRMFRHGEAFEVVKKALTTEIRYQSPVLVPADSGTTGARV